jgi:hypothetical protein
LPAAIETIEPTRAFDDLAGVRAKLDETRRKIPSPLVSSTNCERYPKEPARRALKNHAHDSLCTRTSLRTLCAGQALDDGALELWRVDNNFFKRLEHFAVALFVYGK